ncbi:MAG: DUF938 domain-containing protein [Myxococcales bacterium]|nr:DUF938 domain-containing protein [Myxococcales bacterium]
MSIADPRRHAPATQRNRAPLLDVLRTYFTETRHVLEIASGTGEHALYFGERLPHLTWQTSDIDPDARESIAAWLRDAALPNVRPPLYLDVHQRPWPVQDIDAIVCINMIHISPWSATQALFEEAASLLPSQGILFSYGPYKQEGVHTAPSNEAFDQSLQQRNPTWGVRDLDLEITPLAKSLGFSDPIVVQMPANNLSVVWRKL